jgi:hypothetical protein
MTPALAPVPVMSIRFVLRTVAAPHMCAVLLSLTIEIRVPERVIFSSKRSFHIHGDDLGLPVIDTRGRRLSGTRSESAGHAEHCGDQNCASIPPKDWVDTATSRLGRVHILFGSESASGKAATETILKLRQAFQALDDWPVPDTVTHGRAFDAAQKSHEAFNAAVLVALEAEGSGWTSWRPTWPRKDAHGA